MTKFEKSRQKYLPDRIKYLLVAETPPKTDSKRFFYFEDVTDQDSLFLEIIKCLYPDETSDVETRTIRSNKKYYLEKFMQDGYYLIDSLESPFEEKFSSRQKVSLIKKGQNELLSKIKKLCTSQTKVILIATPVFKANFLFLTTNGLNVINDEHIDFPGAGGQKKFKEKFSALLK